MATVAVIIVLVLTVLMYTLRGDPTWIGLYVAIGIVLVSTTSLAYLHSRFLYIALLCLTLATGAMFIYAASSVYAPFPIKLSGLLTSVRNLEASTYSDERLPAHMGPALLMEWPADLVYVGGEVELEPIAPSAGQGWIRGLWRLGSDAEVEIGDYTARDGSSQICLEVVRESLAELSPITVWTSESGSLLSLQPPEERDEAWSSESDECRAVSLGEWAFLIPLGAIWCTLDGANGMAVEALRVSAPGDSPSAIAPASRFPIDVAWRAEFFSFAPSAPRFGVRLASSSVLAVAGSCALERVDGTTSMIDEPIATVLEGDGIIAAFSSHELLWLNCGQEQETREAFRLECQSRSPQGISWLSLRFAGVAGSLRVGATGSRVFGNARIEFTTREPFSLYQEPANGRSFLFTQACERIYVDKESLVLPYLWSRMGPGYRTLTVSALLGVAATLLVAALSDMRQRSSE